MRWKLVLTGLLILSLMFARSDFSQAQAQAQYSLGIEGVTWNHSTLSILITQSITRLGGRLLISTLLFVP